LQHFYKSINYVALLMYKKIKQFDLSTEAINFYFQIVLKENILVIYINENKKKINK
jgi:hypothetical protein